MTAIRLVMASLWTLICLGAAAQDKVSVRLDDAVFVVSDKFLSVTIDAYTVGKGEWQTLNFTTLKMQNLAQALKPAMLRVGGTSEDYLIFQKNMKTVPNSLAPPTTNSSMTTGDWDAMNEFVRLAGWEFIFGLNVLLRNHTDGSWNTSNARDLMEYTLSKGYDVKWELGNEPNYFPTKQKLSPEQLADDFAHLRELLKNLKLKNDFIAGPDAANMKHVDFFDSFLSNVKLETLNAVTWHHYYLNGTKAVLTDMFSYKVLDTFIWNAQIARDTSFKYLPTTELWLGETSSCDGGANLVLQGSYISGFMWLDKLGIAARTNHSRVFRQSYIGYANSLLNRKDSFNPIPDYWLSVLHKRLVGERVLHVDGGTDLGRKIRVYAHCARQPLYPAGDVVLLLLNTHTYDTSVTLKTSALASAARDVYWLAPPDNPINVLSKEVALNGKVLMLVDNTTLPELPPLQQEAIDTIKLPALTFGFYVFKDAKAKACM